MKSVLLLILFSGLIMAQVNDFAGQVYYNYETYKESSIQSKRFTHRELVPLIEKLRGSGIFNVSTAGHSAEGREIYLISAGNGPAKIFMWSQMHGDESTATMAILDIFNFLSANDQFNAVREKILSNTTLYFMPMVNPDGAEVFKRRNSFDIDINRDAARHTTPEGKVLKEVFDYLQADFGFNLHDQSKYYTAGRSGHSAALSFLAPASEYSKGVDSVRNNAMQLIAHLNNILSMFVPGHIGRYNDDHEPRAFGDNFQKWGTSTILIETGGWKDDPEKQFLRKLNFIALTSSMLSIADKSYMQTDAAGYNSIPFNEELLKDVIIRNLEFEKNGTRIKMDISIDRVERYPDGQLEFISVIDDIGDLSVFYGYEDYDLSGYEIHPGKVLDHKIKNPHKLTMAQMTDYLKQGYTGIVYQGSGARLKGRYPLNITKDKKLKNDISIGNNANFYLTKNGNIDYVFVNGYMYDVRNNINLIRNSVITR